MTEPPISAGLAPAAILEVADDYGTPAVRASVLIHQNLLSIHRHSFVSQTPG